jgi:hypothetical protein
MNEAPETPGDRTDAALELSFGIVLTKSNPVKIAPSVAPPMSPFKRIQKFLPFRC